jgi:radical SAM protein (TIGR01212 family)
LVGIFAPLWQKVHKLTLHGGFSCPNRDGTIGRGGCTFCNVASFADEEQQHRSIAEQLAHQAQRVNRAKRYLAYFQAYTSTFAEVQVLRSMYQQAVSQANIVGLCVGTRPDCVPEAVLDLLSEYREQGYEVWLELGCKPRTIKRCTVLIAGMILPAISVPPVWRASAAESL